MEQKLKKLIEWLFTFKTWNMSMNIMLKLVKPIPKLKISLVILPKKNSNQFILVINVKLKIPQQNLRIFTKMNYLHFLVILTGQNQVSLVQSKIKENVDLVGLFLLLQPLNP
jgi:hypothetical protein